MRRRTNIKRYVTAILLLNGLILLGDNGISTEKASVMAQNIKGNSAVDAGLCVQKIMSCATNEFYNDNPIDEGFWGWMVGKCDGLVLYDFSEAVEKNGAEPELWKKYTGYSIDALWTEYCSKTGFATYSTEDVVSIEEVRQNEQPEEVTLDFIGDICFDSEWGTMKKADSLAQGVSECISSDIQTELKSSSFTVINNEFTYSVDGQALEGKDYTFQADPQSVEYLDVFGADLVSLANNHTYDYGEAGLVSTMQTLKDANISYVGAGNNIKEASKIKYFCTGGYKIAVVSATQIERYSNFTKAATEESAGVLKTNQPDMFCDIIQQAKMNSDYVIVYVHWGDEGSIKYASDQKNLAERFVEAGADAIIGGHPHRLQGVEFIRETPVLYSLGNFWFSSGSMYTTIAQIKISQEGKLTLSMQPCIQKNYMVSYIEEQNDIENFYKYMADISTNVAIDKNGVFYRKQDATGSDLYRSESAYQEHNSDVDLDGNTINKIGNIIE